jgi:hypothetical protein
MAVIGLIVCLLLLLFQAVRIHYFGVEPPEPRSWTEIRREILTIFGGAFCLFVLFVFSARAEEAAENVHLGIMQWPKRKRLGIPKWLVDRASLLLASFVLATLALSQFGVLPTYGLLTAFLIALVICSAALTYVMRSRLRLWLKVSLWIGIAVQLGLIVRFLILQAGPELGYSNRVYLVLCGLLTWVFLCLFAIAGALVRKRKLKELISRFGPVPTPWKLMWQSFEFQDSVTEAKSTEG